MLWRCKRELCSDRMLRTKGEMRVRLCADGVRGMRLFGWFEVWYGGGMSLKMLVGGLCVYLWLVCGW